MGSSEARVESSTAQSIKKPDNVDLSSSSGNTGHQKDRNSSNAQHGSKLETRKVMEWLFAGGISGAASRTAVSPMERLKILQQVQSNSEYTRFWPSLLKMYKEEGFKGFYRGNYLNCLRIFPYSGIQFSTYEIVKVFLGGGSKNEPLSNLERLSAGAIAGCVSVTATYPLDLVRSRLSIATASLGLESSRRDAKLGISSMGKKVYREEGGVRALYRGSVVSCAGIAPYVGCSFAIYEALKSYLPVESNRYMSLLIGAVSGTISQTLTYPCDVLRRKMQVNGIIGPKYNGSIDAVKQIVKTEGVKGLYRGIVANWMKGGFEQIKRGYANQTSGAEHRCVFLYVRIGERSSKSDRLLIDSPELLPAAFSKILETQYKAISHRL